ncbi:fungal-specific transcription factor domain-containing protein [Leptodontidium sp. MPI-SDFR-AT-0119]|nr:fungal-specific transcription factor domain-containing protein [Leptodontidium sp. MPI-SDFR-AT-0119]
MSAPETTGGGDNSKHRNKRGRRACLNCRRKKTRCPGELPACSFCVRLDQPCQYAESSLGRSRLSSRSGSHGQEGPPYWDLIARVAQLEEMVKMPAQAEMAEKSPESQRSQQQCIDNFHPTDLWVPTSSSVLNPSPSAPSPGRKATTSLEDIDRFFPLSIGLIQNAIDAYFVHSHNQPYSFFCESRFRQRAIDGKVPDHVLYAVVAAAAKFMDDQFSKTNFGALCAQLSWNLLLKHLHSDTEADLYFVQATTLLALFDFTNSKSRSAWKKIGTAARIAQDLKLMYEPDPSVHLQEQEEQRRTFWSIYMLDGLSTCGRARPPAFHGQYCKVNLPCTELSFQLGLYEGTQNLDQALSGGDATNRRTDFSPFARVILIATILSRASQYLMQDVNFRTERPPWNGESDHAAISSSLFNFEYQVEIHRPLHEALDMDGFCIDGTDRQSSEHTVFYYALYHLTQCILNHPFLLRCRLRPYSSRVPPIFTSRSFKTCREHAQSLTLLLEDAQRLGCRLRASFLGYCTLVAGTINSLHQYDSDSSIRLQSREALEKNIVFLTMHARYWNNAKMMVRYIVLRECKRINQNIA